MISLLIENPILLLFIVASIGYLVGNISIRGSSLGVAAILFVGLVFGAIDPRLQIPQIILLLGLSIFVYSIGLSSGPAFFNAYRRNGLKDITFIIAMLVLSGLVAIALWAILGFSVATITGVYAGSTTNTAALAGVIDLINNSAALKGNTGLIEMTVVGYSFSYPMGVLGGMIAIVILEKVLKIDYTQEEKDLKKEYPLDQGLTSTTIRVTNPEVYGIQLRDLFRKYNWNVIFGRLYQDEKLSLAHYDSYLEKGDIVMVVGSKEELEQVANVLGESIRSWLTYDRNQFDVRRIFVSNPKAAGRTLASLNISEKYNAVITRIRRGDIEMLAKSNTVLELGDRIRFIARREDLDELAKLFGDSYQESSTINLFTFGLGIGLGVILGTIEFSLGADIRFKLGYAGGPLIVGLILGALRRTGPLIWTMPYSSNNVLRQIGLIFLLATVGVSSGNAFVESFNFEGLWIFIAGSIISLITAFTILLVGYKLIKMPFSILMGIVSNQPAILDFAKARAGNRLPEFGFTVMFPLALIMKVLIAQLIFLVLI